MKRAVYGKSKNGRKTKTLYLVKVIDEHGDWELVRFVSRQKAAWYYANCSDAIRLIRETYEVDTGVITNYVTLSSVEGPNIFEEAVYDEGTKSYPNSTNPWCLSVGKAEKSQL